MNKTVTTIILIFLFSNEIIASQPFVTTWKTDDSGSSNDNQIRIPGEGSYEIYWELLSDPTINGSLSALNKETITFPSPGTYKVEITGSLERIHFNFLGDKWKIRSIEAWGDVAWTRMDYAFAGCFYMSNNATDSPDLSLVTDCQYMLGGCNYFRGNLSNWDVSQVENMSYMFAGCGTFNGNITNWNTSSVTNMRGMFSSASLFNQAIEDWNVSKVTVMANMFSEAETFNQDISTWDVSNVIDMGAMFDTANEFNQDIGGWDVSSVENMSYMFNDAQSFDQNLGLWDISIVSNLTDMFNLTVLSMLNYDATLIGWSALNLVHNLNFGGGSSQYCAGEKARDKITADFKWNISDGGKSTTCDPNNFVINTNNEGPGSLRNALLNASSSNIYFSPILTDSTITLINDPLMVTDTYQVHGISGKVPIINGENLTTVFSFPMNLSSFTLRDLSVYFSNNDGLVTTSGQNFELNFTDVSLGLGPALSLILDDNIELTVSGLVKIFTY